VQILKIYQQDAEELLSLAEQGRIELDLEACDGMAAKILGMHKSLRHFVTNEEPVPESFKANLKKYEEQLHKLHKERLAFLHKVCVVYMLCTACVCV
jgi:hypothetical protein